MNPAYLRYGHMAEIWELSPSFRDALGDIWQAQGHLSACVFGVGA